MELSSRVRNIRRRVFSRSFASFRVMFWLLALTPPARVAEVDSDCGKRRILQMTGLLPNQLLSVRVPVNNALRAPQHPRAPPFPRLFKSIFPGHHCDRTGPFHLEMRARGAQPAVPFCKQPVLHTPSHATLPAPLASHRAQPKI